MTKVSTMMENVIYKWGLGTGGVRVQPGNAGEKRDRQKEMKGKKRQLLILDPKTVCG